MILKSTHFFQSLRLGAEGGGGCERDSTVHAYTSFKSISLIGCYIIYMYLPTVLASNQVCIHVDAYPTILAVCYVLYTEPDSRQGV